MIDDAERFDHALEGGDIASDDDNDMQTLVALATEVVESLHRTWLTPVERERLYARALELLERGSRIATLRRALADHRVRAIAGGAAVAVAAGTAITVALLRQHRHHAPMPV